MDGEMGTDCKTDREFQFHLNNKDPNTRLISKLGGNRMHSTVRAMEAYKIASFYTAGIPFVHSIEASQSKDRVYRASLYIVFNDLVRDL